MREQILNSYEKVFLCYQEKIYRVDALKKHALVE
jgi:hypothetical protein